MKMVINEFPEIIDSVLIPKNVLDGTDNAGYTRKMGI
jgi:hypothetical protein